MARPQVTGRADGLPSRQGVCEHKTDSENKPLSKSMDMRRRGGSTWENKPVLREIFHLHSETRLRVGEAFPLLPPYLLAVRCFMNKPEKCSHDQPTEGGPPVSVYSCNIL